MKNTTVSHRSITKNMFTLIKSTLAPSLFMLAFGSTSTIQAELRTNTFDSNLSNWTSANNNTGGNSFGYTNSNVAGGAAAGEAGGTMHNYGPESYYADTDIGRLDLNTPFSATVKYDFHNLTSTANSDYIGYFSTNTIDKSVIGLNLQDFFGVNLKVRAAITLSDGTDVGTGIIAQAQDSNYTLTFSYNPNIGSGQFVISAPAGLAAVNLTPAQRAIGATFDAFGLYGFPAAYPGGNSIDLFIDDAIYTVPEPSVVCMTTLAGIGLIWRRRNR